MMNLKLINRIDFRVGLFFIFFIWFGLYSPLFAYEVVTVNNGGELQGTISYKGPVPANEYQEVSKDADFCGAKIQEETYLVNAENNGLQNVVIWVEGVTQGKAPVSSVDVIENLKCHFVPHVQAGMIGQVYEVRNLDPIMHNTHLKMEEHTLLNIIMPTQGKNIRKMIHDPGLIRIKCDVHKFMKGWLIATENPYFAVTDRDGKFKISEIPAGKYNIMVWHEGLPTHEREVKISPGINTELSIALSLK